MKASDEAIKDPVTGYRDLVKGEAILATDIGLSPITHAWEPIGDCLAVGKPYEPGSHWPMRRPAPAQEKPTMTPKPPKPTKTQTDLAEARKRVKALEELNEVEVQMESDTKSHRKTMADLRARRDALRAEAYPKGKK